MMKFLGKRNKITKDKIIQSLNDDSFFPALGNLYFEFIHGRLTCFRSEESWLICFQLITNHLNTTSGYRLFHLFGNVIENNAHFELECILKEKKTEDNPHQLIDYDCIDPYEFEYEVCGELNKYRVDKKYYEKYDKKFDFIEPLSKVLLYLSFEYESLMILEPSEIIEKFDLEKHKMNLLIDTFEWKHPEYFNDTDGISESELVKNLALAIEKDDATMFDWQENNAIWEYWI
jgi:hypothetical protein